MNVRAKFQCHGLTHLPTSNPNDVNVSATFGAVYNNSPENAVWSKYTPSGQIMMNITNPGAIAAFEIGKEYYIDFTLAEPELEAELEGVRGHP